MGCLQVFGHRLDGEYFLHVQLQEEGDKSLDSNPESDAESSPDLQQYTYNVKIMNPTRKSNYVVWKFQSLGRFSSVKSLKSKLLDKLSLSVNLQPSEEDNLEVGFISAGHDLKGRQCWIVDLKDIQQMYKEYERCVCGVFLRNCLRRVKKSYIFFT